MREIWQQCQSELEANRKVFLAFVAECTKGSPGTPNACLLLSENNQQLGTIGGGIMEKRLLDLGITALASPSFQPRLQRLEHREKVSNASGLFCGGAQSNVVIRLEPTKDLPTLTSICKHWEEDRDSQVEINPRGIALNLTSNPPSYPVLENPDTDDWSFRLPNVNQRRIAIFGAGHCGSALARQMDRLGYRVFLTDSRSNIPTDTVNHSSISLLSGIAPEEACSKIKRLSTSDVVVMTHSYPSDLDALLAVIPYHPPFLGLMGSPAKLNRIRRKLRVKGISEECIQKLRAPVGLAIGSDTPEEIAVSVAAQLIQENKARLSAFASHANHIPA